MFLRGEGRVLSRHVPYNILLTSLFCVFLKSLSTSKTLNHFKSKIVLTTFFALTFLPLIPFPYSNMPRLFSYTRVYAKRIHKCIRRTYANVYTNVQMHVRKCVRTGHASLHSAHHTQTHLFPISITHNTTVSITLIHR